MAKKQVAKKPTSRNAPKETTSVKGKSPKCLKGKKLSPIQGYRSNVEAILRMITTLKLKHNQIEMLKKSPFFNMFNALNNHKDVKLRKSDNTIQDIIKCYDPTTGKFKLGKKYVEVTVNDVSIIFGIKSGSIPMDMKLRCAPGLSSLVNRHFLDCTTRIKISSVKKVLIKLRDSNEKEDIQDLVRLLTMFAMATLFFASKGDFITSTFVYYVEDIEKIKEYDWAQAIRDSVMQSIRKNHMQPLMASGCVTLLSYWFNEHTKVFTPNRQLLPRFMKWVLPKKNVLFKETHIDTLKQNQVITGDLVFSPEEDAMFSNDAREENTQIVVFEEPKVAIEKLRENMDGLSDENFRSDKIMSETFCDEANMSERTTDSDTLKFDTGPTEMDRSVDMTRKDAENGASKLFKEASVERRTEEDGDGINSVVANVLGNLLSNKKETRVKEKKNIVSQFEVLNEKINEMDLRINAQDKEINDLKIVHSVSIKKLEEKVNELTKDNECLKGKLNGNVGIITDLIDTVAGVQSDYYAAKLAEKVKEKRKKENEAVQKTVSLAKRIRECAGTRHGNIGDDFVHPNEKQNTDG